MHNNQYAIVEYSEGRDVDIDTCQWEKDNGKSFIY